MKSFKKIFALLILALVIFSGCSPKSNNISENKTASETITLTDREGKEIKIKTDIEKIVSLSPAITEMLIELGLSEKIVGADNYSTKILGNENIPSFDLMKPDSEILVNLSPDIIYATDMSKVNGSEPLKLISDMGIPVTYVPVSKSIEDIKLDILFVSESCGKKPEGEKIVEDMTSEIEKYKSISQTIKNKKSVYFEIADAPNLYTFGKGVFLDELINIIGAKNIFENENGWISVSSENVVSANPDVIITNVDYLEDPVAAIKGRTGFDGTNAVKNNEVYLIDNAISSYTNQNIIKALKEISVLVYPEEYASK